MRYYNLQTIIIGGVYNFVEHSTLCCCCLRCLHPLKIFKIDSVVYRNNEKIHKNKCEKNEHEYEVSLKIMQSALCRYLCMCNNTEYLCRCRYVSIEIEPQQPKLRVSRKGISNKE